MLFLFSMYARIIFHIINLFMKQEKQFNPMYLICTSIWFSIVLSMYAMFLYIMKINFNFEQRIRYKIKQAIQSHIIFGSWGLNLKGPDLRADRQDLALGPGGSSGQQLGKVGQSETGGTTAGGGATMCLVRSCNQSTKSTDSDKHHRCIQKTMQIWWMTIAINV